jgi:hypothetical protein
MVNLLGGCAAPGCWEAGRLVGKKPEEIPGTQNPEERSLLIVIR